MKKRLLITDDAMIIRTMIRDLATEAGWEVVAEATNGAEAVERYREFRPDAVTLDLVMPEFDGLHGLRGIREIDPDARVIVVSALNTQNVLKESFKLGATDFVLKPFQKQPLMETLEQAVATGN